MSYPLVTELAGDGIPVAVTCRVLKLSRAPYYRWLAAPVTALELRQAYLANALFDAHRDDRRVRAPPPGRRSRPGRSTSVRPDRLGDLLRQSLVECLREEARKEREETRPASPRRPRRAQVHRQRRERAVAD